MDPKILRDTLDGAFRGDVTFPETVRRLVQAGVERYRADLARLEKTHYDARGECRTESMPLSDAPGIAEAYSEDRVRSALVDVQQGRIRYPEFLRRIMGAGVVEYTVFLSGRRAIYTSRTGEFYVEPFPAGLL